jgi:hypothetical protein
MYNIEMIPFNPETVIPDGKYLVKTESTKLPGMSPYHYLQTRCSCVNGKVSVDVSGQTVIEISKEPLSL